MPGLILISSNLDTCTSAKGIFIRNILSTYDDSKGVGKCAPAQTIGVERSQSQPPRFQAC